jgi:RNA polymerase sigma factor (TIGR02999 family)
MDQPSANVTALLQKAGQGDTRALEELFRLVEPVLRQRAQRCLENEPAAQELQTTMLVDDAFLRLVGDQEIEWQNRAQFYCLAAKVMRRILVDEARKRAALKRHGQPTATLDPAVNLPDPKAVEPMTRLALDDALTGLAESHPDLVEIVELHVFAGWDLKQIANQILRVPYITVKRRWQRAKALLYRDMCGDSHDT